MTNFYAQLDAVFAANADRDCLMLPGQPGISFGAMRDRVAAVGGVLLQQGVRPGDRVAVQVEKSPENLCLYLATLRIGAVYLPLNTAYTSAELDYFIGDAEPALFVGNEGRNDVRSLTLLADGSGSLMDLAGSAAPAEIAQCAGTDLAAILYTSGTTGRSKGAMLSHDNLASNAQALSEAWDWQDNDVLLHALPIFHVHGLFIASHCALLNGTPMIWLPKFDAKEVAAALPDATVLMGVPTFYVRLLGLPGFAEQSMAHIRVFICGSAPLTGYRKLKWRPVRMGPRWSSGT